MAERRLPSITQPAKTERKLPRKLPEERPQVQATPARPKQEAPYIKEVSEAPIVGPRHFVRSHDAKPIKAFRIANALTIFYRVRSGSSSDCEHREYLIGFVQFAYVRKDRDDGFRAIMINGRELTSTKGARFKTEQACHDWLERELLGKE